MAQRTATEIAHVVAVVCLSAGRHASEPRLVPVRGSSLFAQLVPSLVRFALDDSDAHVRELATLSRLCRIPAYDLVRPYDAARVGKAADLLADLLAGGYDPVHGGVPIGE